MGRIRGNATHRTAVRASRDGMRRLHCLLAPLIVAGLAFALANSPHAAEAKWTVTPLDQWEWTSGGQDLVGVAGRPAG